jgi:hypothetical protein
MVLREKIFKTITDVFSMCGHEGVVAGHGTNAGKSVTAASPSTRPYLS